MFKKIFLLINIFSLTLQLDHCLRTYEICTECKSDYFLVRNEWQYYCSHIKECITEESNKCLECSIGYYPDINGNFECKSYFSLINNCRTYNEDDNTKCIECMDGYALSNDNSTCIEHENCRQLDANNHCKLCAKHYLLKNNECVKSLCEIESNGICTNCTEGYYLDDGKCELIPIDNCLKFEEDLCTECFHFAQPSEDLTECILDKLISGCNKVDATDDTKCIHCSLGYQLSADGKKCELTNCNKIEEMCYECKKGYFIADNGKLCIKSDPDAKEEEEEEKNPDKGINKNFSFYLRNKLVIVFVLVLFL